MANATNLLSFRPTGIRASASSGCRKPENVSRKASSANWWTPLFGWGSDPDYIDGKTCSNNNGNFSDLSEGSESETERTARSRPRFAPGCFTEEKAKQLRLMTKETNTYHDMYHSAIASRLATDFANRSDQ